MRFLECFEGAERPVISFEIFPPRSEKARDSLERVVPRLVALEPSYMTVTYGALGSTRVETIEYAGRLRKVFGVEAACHLTCVGATASEINAVLDRIRGEGIESIVALRGDPPEGEETFVVPEGGYRHANELVAHIRRRDEFGIAVAGYPEKHIEAVDMETDLGYLKQKVDAGGDIVITQLFYDNADFFAFEKRVRELGIEAPVVPGLMPIQSFAQIKKISGLCGATIPEELEERLRAAGDDKAAITTVGVEWTTAQATELLDRGAPGIHFYVLNRASQMERIMAEIRD